MNIEEATVKYEAWMRACGIVVNAELVHKHARMRRDAFEFFRGTYYRWAQLWPAVCIESSRAPVVLSVGDLHIDSYGTWRDAEGRMCWGVDDFDESWPLPYTNDLTRLAASVKVARKLGILSIRTKDACKILLKEYERALRQGGHPFVLAEEEMQLEKLGIESLKPPQSFWQNLTARVSIRGHLPRDVKYALEKTLPTPDLKYRIVRREAGLGSLGQLRLVAIADCRGGYIAREAKKLLPSANMWLNGKRSHSQSYYAKTMNSAVRSPDPYQKIIGTWLIRRLSPDSNPIKIETLPKKRDEGILLQAMAMEAANVHLGTAHRRRAILSDLRRRGRYWLHHDAKKMAKVVLREWKEYRR